MTLSISLSKDSIRRAFDRARDTYAKAARIQADAARLCAARIPRGEYPQILEIGAGGGVLSSHVAERCRHSSYVAVDISPQMLAQVDQRALTNPCLMVADGECLNLSKEHYDLLVSSSTMQWYNSPEVSIHDNLSLLKHGGAFSFSMYVEGTYPEFAEASEATGFGNVLPMRASVDYVGIVQDASPMELKWETSTYVLHYATVSDLLRAHRSTGATATFGNKQPSKKAYKAFIDYYEERFCTGEGVRLTAQILHVWGRR